MQPLPGFGHRVPRPGGRVREFVPPDIDPIGPERRVDFDKPVQYAYLGGRLVALARPLQKGGARPGEPYNLTVPLSVSRMRRAVDIELDRSATGPFVPSALVGVGAAVDRDTPKKAVAYVSGAILGGSLGIALMVPLLAHEDRRWIAFLAGAALGSAFGVSTAAWNLERKKGSRPTGSD